MLTCLEVAQNGDRYNIAIERGGNYDLTRLYREVSIYSLFRIYVKAHEAGIEPHHVDPNKPQWDQGYYKM